ncbi:MAG TPA: cofactor-independent phosphoglycerate mutase [Spirochaetota bacterium]|nr:cofactor-independent phosphoglycerate mutase [Spirochaetota bacterium]HPS87422.1 cofactor-independent phosphoglycerate mutase [Spirochaetota bacterium]
MNNRKYIVLLGDGMADLPLDELGGKTILEYCKTPNMDFMAQNGVTGLTNAVPNGMAPGSDTANLSIFGYDPAKYFSGRAPLEAINLGIELGPDDTAFRCNIVNAAGGVMNDFTSAHIDSRLSEIIMQEMMRNISRSGIEFHPGVSYRNIMVWRNFPYKEITETTPPHDIQNENTEKYLPAGNGSDIMRELMFLSKSVISDSAAIKDGLNKYQGNPESIWLWGGGRKPAMNTLKERFGLYGHTISAVDLIHGIGKAAGLTPLHVDGVTGYIDTNYTGKADALLNSIADSNFIFLHVESPDESGHEGSIEHKIKSIEDFDSLVVGPVLKGMKKYPEYCILLMPDHPTPVKIRTHTSDPVPFCIFSSGGSFTYEKNKYHAASFCEKEAAATGLFIDHAHNILEVMIKGSI